MLRDGSRCDLCGIWESSEKSSTLEEAGVKTFSRSFTECISPEKEPPNEGKERKKEEPAVDLRFTNKYNAIATE